jgi:ABC-type transport system involved in multi-copper enzyme maturation permease subunit
LRKKGVRDPSREPVTVKKPKRRRPWRFSNALLSWELLRVSRRTGALAVGRFAFGAALLGMMWLLYSARFAQNEVISGDISKIAKELQRFADEFSLTFFLVQLTIALLLTPIFVAGSVFEERETRSGEVLLTTDLTRREVFYGKFLARVVQVMMVVAAGMPVLALTLLWGGVAVEFIAIGYIATFLCIFSAGAITASVAGSSETMRGAVLKAYGYILVFDLLIFPASPYVFIAVGRESATGLVCLGVAFLTVQLTIALVSLAHGLRWLRLAMLRQRRRITDEMAVQMAGRKPPVADENPLLWKERFVGPMNETASAALITVSIGGVLGILILVLLGVGMFPAGWVASYVSPFVIGAAATIIGMSAAGGVARERQKNTLIDLFMIPGRRREILRAKLLGAFWNARWALAPILVLLPMSVVGGTPAIAMPLQVVAAAVFLLFSAALGVWLSVRCRTALNANAAWMGSIAIFLIGTFLLADAMSHRERTPSGESRTEYPKWSRVISPVMAWQELTMSPDDPLAGSNSARGFHPRIIPDHHPRLLAPLVGVGIFGIAAGLLWLLAVRRFEREGREV